MNRSVALRDALRRSYHAARRAADDYQHPRRHLRALTRLRGLASCQRVLVVCHGNICRSPYLEAVLQRDLPNATISSAGFLRAERPVPENARLVAAERGFDMSAFRSTTITRSITAAADIIIVMDARQAEQVVRDLGAPAERVVIAGDLDPARGQRRAIRDPWNQPIEVFIESFDRLDRCATTLVGVLGQRARTPAVALTGEG